MHVLKIEVKESIFVMSYIEFQYINTIMSLNLGINFINFNYFLNQKQQIKK